MSYGMILGLIYNQFISHKQKFLQVFVRYHIYHFSTVKVEWCPIIIQQEVDTTYNNSGMTVQGQRVIFSPCSTAGFNRKFKTT